MTEKILIYLPQEILINLPEKIWNNQPEKIWNNMPEKILINRQKEHGIKQMEGIWNHKQTERTWSRTDMEGI